MLDFEYVDGGAILPEGAIRISPSQFEKFFSKPHEWYRNQLLGESDFDGNTNTELGTIVHACAEAYAKGIEFTAEEVEKHIETLRGKDDVNVDEILQHWKPMVQALINQYLKANKPTETERFIYTEIAPGFFPSGSVDNRTGSMVVDYKTTSNLTAPTSISYAYKLQLLVYAWIYTQLGIPIDRIRIVYVTRNNVGRVSESTGKPLQDYPSKVSVLTETIGTDDLDFIESLLNLCVETIQATQQYPELTHVFWKDMRLKLPRRTQHVESN